MQRVKAKNSKPCEAVEIILPDRLWVTISKKRDCVSQKQKLQKYLWLDLVIMAMPNHKGNMYAARQVWKPEVQVSGGRHACFPEKVDELSEIGLCAAYLSKSAHMTGNSK